MSVDRREFLKRLALTAAVLAPAALIAGCPTKEEAAPPVDPSPPAPDDSHEGHDHEGHDHDNDGDDHAEGTASEGDEDAVLGADPAKVDEGALAFECPKCHQMNALPDHKEGDSLPMIKCRVCAHVWQAA